MTVFSLTFNNFPELVISWFYIHGLFQAFQNATVDKFMINCTTGISHCLSFVSNYVHLHAFGSLSSLAFIPRSLLIGVLCILAE